MIRPASGGWIGRGSGLSFFNARCLTAMVILKEASEVLVQTSFAEHDYVIKALAANSTDHPFDIRTLPRRPWCRKHLFDTHCLHLNNEVLAEEHDPDCAADSAEHSAAETLAATAERSLPSRAP
jgi:hypothetical protein